MTVDSTALIEEPLVGVVVIGRNEGERLRACLRSVCGEEWRIVYVDSGSTDASVGLAREMGADVVPLDMSLPFSAARARNAGFARLCELCPEVRYVQFVDGDCEVIPGWIPAALAVLERERDAAVVCGRRRERFPERSVYNALCDVEWDTPIGETNSCGGDAMMRVEVFASAGGYDASMVAGEEPELCVRIRARGWRVLRMAEEMTLHDANISRFSQWWKRTVRAGHAYAELASLHGADPGRPGVREVVSNIAWGAALPAGLAVAFTAPQAAALGVGLYATLALRIFRHQIALGRSYEQAVAYACSCAVGKVPEALGAARFLFGSLTGKRSRIIEYKG